MQIKSLRVKSYRSWRINDNASGEAITRLKQLELYATCTPSAPVGQISLIA